VVVPVAGRYCCKDPGCPRVLQSAKDAAKRKKVSVSDSAWDEATISKFCPNGATFSTNSEM